jgi:hypothetical protein
MNFRFRRAANNRSCSSGLYKLSYHTINIPSTSTVG